MPTDKEVVILSEEVLQETETRPWAYPPHDSWMETPLPSRHVILTVAERDALCATVRALRAENDELRQHVNDLNHDLNATSKHCEEYHQ